MTPIVPSSALDGRVATIRDFFVESTGSKKRTLMWTTSYLPDGTARELVEFLTNRLGELRERTVTTYDEAGHRCARVSFDSEGNLLAQTVFRFDDRGGLVEEVRSLANGTKLLTISTEFDHDPEGRVLEARRYFDGWLSEVKRYSVPGRGR